MRIATCLALVLAAAALLGGCMQEDRGIGSGTSAASPPAAKEQPAQPAEAPAERKWASSPTRQLRLEPLGGSESSLVTMMLPAGDRDAAVYLEKAAPKQVLVGKEFDYKIRVTNTSRSTLEDMTLIGKLPQAFRVVATTPKANIVGTDATWDVGKLAPDESKTFVVRGAATKAGSLYGCSDVTFRISSACVSIAAVQPALKVVQTAPAAVLICEPIPIRIVVTNTGSGPASNVVVKETLPEGLMTMDGKTEVSYGFKTLEAGQSREVTIEAKAAKTGRFVAKAAATGADGLAAAADSSTVVREPVLALTHDAPKSRFLGLTVTNTLTVTNNGDGVAKGTRLVTSLPARCDLVSASGGIRAQAGRLTWNLGDLAPEASKKVTFVLKPAAIGRVESSSSVSALCVKTSTKAVTDVQGIPAILLECVDEDDPIELGAQVTYAITVTNQGTAAGTNIVIKCTLPAEQEYFSATGPTKETVKARTVTFAPLKSLAPKAKTTYKVVVKALKAADVRFAVSLTSDQLTEPVAETESTNQYAD
jgi:uncharacterized repeat protein (TIGR01451 family)